jgi:hypothetical protein
VEVHSGFGAAPSLAGRRHVASRRHNQRTATNSEPGAVATGRANTKTQLTERLSRSFHDFAITRVETD